MTHTADNTAAAPVVLPCFFIRNKGVRLPSRHMPTDTTPLAAVDPSEFRERWNELQRRGPPTTSTPQ